MNTKRKYLLLSTVLLSVLLGVIPMTLAMPIGDPYTQTKSATYKHDLEGGFWVETTLKVTIRYYPGGQKSFSYSMSHRESKPWIAVWYSPHCGVALYEQNPGVWTALNKRKIILLPLCFVYYMYVYVHFNENTMTFYYSVSAWNNAVPVFEAWMEVLKGWG